jgi:hypothetical protein
MDRLNQIDIDGFSHDCLRSHQSPIVSEVFLKCFLQLRFRNHDFSRTMENGNEDKVTSRESQSGLRVYSAPVRTVIDFSASPRRD